MNIIKDRQYFNFAAAEIIIPNDTIIIGSEAFRECKNLKEIVIPKSVESIADGAFRNCKNLKKVIFENDNCFMSEKIFYDCESLEEVHLPKNLKKISDSTFYCCWELKEIKLPPSLKTIDNYAFEACGLENIVFPTSLEKVGRYAFKNCKIETLNFDCDLKEIEPGFESDSLKTLIINSPYTIKYFDNKFIENCPELKSISLSNIENICLDLHKFDEIKLTEYTRNKLIESKKGEKFDISKYNIKIIDISLESLLDSNRTFKELSKIYKDMEK